MPAAGGACSGPRRKACAQTGSAFSAAAISTRAGGSSATDSAPA